jgi:hypothetical protein
MFTFCKYNCHFVALCLPYAKLSSYSTGHVQIPNDANHIMFDYTRQFNTLAQYGTYHVDTNTKKANLYRTRLTIYL